MLSNTEEYMSMVLICSNLEPPQKVLGTCLEAFMIAKSDPQNCRKPRRRVCELIRIRLAILQASCSSLGESTAPHGWSMNSCCIWVWIGMGNVIVSIAPYSSSMGWMLIDGFVGINKQWLSSVLPGNVHDHLCIFWPSWYPSSLADWIAQSFRHPGRETFASMGCNWNSLIISTSKTSYCLKKYCLILRQLDRLESPSMPRLAIYSVLRSALMDGIFIRFIQGAVEISMLLFLGLAEAWPEVEILIQPPGGHWISHVWEITCFRIHSE